MEVDKKDDEEGNEEAAEEDVRKNKDEFWCLSESSGSEPSYRRSRADLRIHKSSRPRRERPRKKNPVKRGRVAKRGGVSSRRIRVSKRGAPAKRKPKLPPKPVRKIVSASSLGVSTASGCSDGASSCCPHCAANGKNRRIAETQTEPESVSKLHSPLLVKTYVQLQADPPAEQDPFLEVTPDMIVDSLRHVTMWRQSVPDYVVLDYIKKNYPVNPNYEALMIELSTKLTIAATVGFIEKCVVKHIDHWCLKTGLQKRKLMKNHVDLFWKLYVDTHTLNPALRRILPKPRPNIVDRDTNTGVKHYYCDTDDQYEDNDRFGII